MKKIMIIGCPGSGKSTFAIKLQNLVKIQVFHLELLNWNSDKTTVEKEVFINRLSEVISKDEWIIDGNYGSTIEMRLKECDTVLFLDYSTELCIEGAKKRLGKKRKDMPWVETEIDNELIDFINNFKKNNRPKILELLKKYTNKQIYIFRNREESDVFLKTL